MKKKSQVSSQSTSLSDSKVSFSSKQFKIRLFPHLSPNLKTLSLGSTPLKKDESLNGKRSLTQLENKKVTRKSPKRMSKLLVSPNESKKHEASERKKIKLEYSAEPVRNKQDEYDLEVCLELTDDEFPQSNDKTKEITSIHKAGNNNKKSHKSLLDTNYNFKELQKSIQSKTEEKSQTNSTSEGSMGHEASPYSETNETENANPAKEIEKEEKPRKNTEVKEEYNCIAKEEESKINRKIRLFPDKIVRPGHYKQGDYPLRIVKAE